MALFQNSVLNKYLKGLDKQNLNDAYERFTSHFHNPTIQENIRNNKEEQYQGEFLIDLFVNVLGYTKNPTPDFNLTTELKNIKGSKKTDGAILKGDKALAVIELKGTNTTDLSKVETQAFGYKNNQPGCNYVITSNFEKLRFYIDNAVDFEEFNLFQLSKERFEILWLCLSSDYLLKDSPKKIKDESLTQEENVTKKLYKDYASFRNEIFDAIQKENPEYDKLTLFKKTQKLLDRFLFIFFAEDRLLLPPNSIRSIVNQWTDLRDKYDAYVPLYNRFKKYFEYMNTGHKGQQHDIFAYNGGLFAPDDVLDHITINDDLLHKHTLNLSNYDFESEVSVNILGHIFEHSLNDIDEIQAEIQGTTTEQSKTKRKKDGVFYTPKYITKYIVDNTVGKLCEEKKAELDISDETYQPAKQRSRKRLKALQTYRDWLLQLTICDPACGSGAFLNQALEFLIAEHAYIDELSAKYNKDALILSDVENAILENNLFGVDINEESVEIAKLSLWLRTAQKGRKLTALNKNIKCGNSLIDDPTVAGDKAFNWETEFPEVFTKGGFDVVIGNPPYLGGRDWKDSDGRNYDYLLNKYEVAEYQFDMYVLFWEKGIKLLKCDGLLGYITPITWLNNQKTKKLRRFILENTTILEMIDFSEVNVFKDAVVLTMIGILKNTSYQSGVEVRTLKPKNENFELDFNYINQNAWINDELNIININLRNEDTIILNKIEEVGNPLEDFSTVKFGIKLYETGKGNPPQSKNDAKEKVFESDRKIDDSYRPYLEGKDIDTYKTLYKGKWLKYGDNLAAPRSRDLFEGERIVVRRIVGERLISTFINSDYVTSQLLQIVKPNSQINSKEILALLNSSLLAYYFRKKYNRIDKTFPEIRVYELRSLPVITNSKYKIDLVKKVNEILDLNERLEQTVNRFQKYLQQTFQLEKLSKKLQNWHDLEFGDFIKELNKAIKANNKQRIKEDLEEVPTLTKKDEFEWLDLFEDNKQKAQALQTQINQTDAAIDAMVYELYGLTEEEIEIVENS
ncbi:MAG: Eco57I restriction-modification methylase domain-containing protein [Winogradskyella sp.]